MLTIKNCDNLELSKNINSNTIDLIYSDILYGTGRNFEDYQDLKPIRSEIESHYIPRIREMYRILKETGLIYLQMDYRINHWVRCILDDIFGYENFRNEIVWSYNSAPRKKNCFGYRHDIILRYSKSDNFTFNEIREPYSENINKPKSKLKYYNSKGKVIGDVWNINILAQNDKTERCGYATQKPEKLIERIILSSSNECDTVADFYLGSGTTAVVCKKLNRNFIGCDISKKAVDITFNRLENIKTIFDGVKNVDN
jgi:DNA modification methylase